MAENNSINLNYTVDKDKITWDLYMMDISLIPSLTKQLTWYLHMQTSSVSFMDERAERARLAGITPERQMSMDLKLKTH